MLVRNHLRKAFPTESITFSEDASTYGHHPSNPGFYEAQQLNDAAAVIVLLPAQRSLGVNTWEVTLVCETDALDKPLHLTKTLFLFPESVWQYLCDFFEHAPRYPNPDPARFIPGTRQPEFGPANSFLIRWLSMTVVRDYRARLDAVPKMPPVSYAVYPDNERICLKDLYPNGKYHEIFRKMADRVTEVLH